MSFLSALADVLNFLNVSFSCIYTWGGGGSSGCGVPGKAGQGGCPIKDTFSGPVEFSPTRGQQRAQNDWDAYRKWDHLEFSR